MGGPEIDRRGKVFAPAWQLSMESAKPNFPAPAPPPSPTEPERTLNGTFSAGCGLAGYLLVIVNSKRRVVPP